MKKPVFKKLMSLALCAVLLTGTLPAAAFAEETQTITQEAQPAETGLTEAEVQAILGRNMGTWYFPLVEDCYDQISDYCGCRGSQEDPFYHLHYEACKYPEHALNANGNNALHIEVYYDGTEVMAPTDGTLYRSAYSDPKWGYNVVIEQQASPEYSYYIILANLGPDAPVASGTAVSGGNVVGFTKGYPVMLSCVMDASGKGSQLANDLSGELDRIHAYGWLTQSYGTGMICVNPSSNTHSSYWNYLTNFLYGPVTYVFTTPTYIEQPTETPTVPAETPTFPVEPPTEAPTEAPTVPEHQHTWDAGFQSVAPTHFAEGQMVYTCTGCGATQTVAIPRTEEHVYDQQNVADAYLASPASCVSPAAYYYSCICGATGTETFTVGTTSGHLFSDSWSMDSDYHWHAAICEHTGEKDAMAPHSWDSGVTLTAPTHSQSGQMMYTCTVCGATKTAPVDPSADHVFDQTVMDARYLKSEATCTEPATYYYSCTCGEKGTETFTVGQALGHTFADAWTTNETHHWHAATCTHTGEVGDFAEHTWDAGKVITQAGHNVNGEIQYTCTVCGLTRNEVVPGTAHAYDQQVVADKYLKSAATCTSPAVYYKSCVCGEAGTDTFTSGDAKGHTYSDTWSYNETQHWQAATCEHTGEKIKVADHIWDGGTITVAPTGTSKGERTFTCVVCKATKKEALDATTHEHTFATTWSGNETYHWHAATCGHSNEMSGFGEHNWNGGVVISYPTHTTKGETLYTCQTCGASKKVTVAEQHTFNQMNTASAYVKNYATCTLPATYYYSCTCGAKGTETFTSGVALGHSYGSNWNSDANGHWHTCTTCGTRLDQSAHYYGTGTACQTCGYAKTDAHVHTSHLSRVPAKSATCVSDGNIAYYTCQCGKWFTDVTATVEITDRDSVITPATGHVDKDNNGRCDVCKERLSTETVEYVMTEGSDTTWLNTSSQGLVFRCNADFAKFDHVEVDGNTISSLNYTVSNGSTIVELNASYMKRLTIGQHKIAIVSSDGRADASFTIKQGSASNRDEEGGRSVLWVVVAGIAILAMIAAAVVAGYILITNKPGKKGGKFAK